MSNSYILFKELSFQVIDTCFKVHTALGCGLPEHCYQRSLEIAFTNLSIPFTAQQKHDIQYNDIHVGHFFSDLIIDNKIILELKSDERITFNHESQLITYLKATKLRVGYVINFGVKSLGFKRLII